MNQESSYKKNTNKIMSLANFEYDKDKGNPPGFHLARVEYLMRKFNYPNINQVFIHVAGSKGKGSTSNLISNGLSDQKVGLFTSPHMHSLTERIKINNKPISKKMFNFYFEKVWPIVEVMKKEIKQQPSFFEFITLLALVVFRDEKVNLSIIEVGLGGRLDSTNIITPTISVITQISKDHTNILGSTLKQIAFEKAGIIKQNIPVVISNQTKSVFEVIKKTSKEKKSKLYSSKEIEINSEYKKNYIQEIEIDKKYKFKTSLLGDHQLENIKTALKTIELYKRLKEKKIDWSDIANKISKTEMTGRCQVLTEKNIITFSDGAQNNKSAKALVNVLKKTGINMKEILWIYGASEGHNSIDTIKVIKKYNPKIIITESRIPKAKKSKKIFEELKDLRLNIIELTKNTFDAHNKARTLLNSHGIIVAFGSLYIAAEIVEIIKNIKPENYNYG